MLAGSGISAQAQNVSFSPSKYKTRKLDKALAHRINSTDTSKKKGVFESGYHFAQRMKNSGQQTTPTVSISEMRKKLDSALLSRTDSIVSAITDSTVALLTRANNDPSVNNDSLARLIARQSELRRDAIIDLRKRYSLMMRALEVNTQQPRNTLLFPALTSTQAISFYLESDTMSSKFFASNNLIYNGAKQKLGFGSEAYADFFGPVRFSLGFLLTSASNADDSTKGKEDAIQKITSTGGNIFSNISFPLLNYSDLDFLSIKSSVFTTFGVDIPKDSINASSYGLINTSGVAVNIYSQGFLRVLQLFYTGKLSYVIGNKNFENRLSANQFWMLQNSFGIAIKDNFRVRLDVYSGLSGSKNEAFVRSSFPVTLSFDIINPF